MDGIDSTSFVQAAAFIGSAFSMAVGSIGPALGQGMIGRQACESVGKYPESAGKIQMTMMISLGAVESSAVYNFIVAIMLLLKV
jgi:F-type H+-transporting ATPase subunit c